VTDSTSDGSSEAGSDVKRFANLQAQPRWRLHHDGTVTDERTAVLQCTAQDQDKYFITMLHTKTVFRHNAPHKKTISSQCSVKNGASFAAHAFCLKQVLVCTLRGAKSQEFIFELHS